MTTTDYRNAAREMRETTKEYRDELGRRLIADMKAAWGRGETSYTVPPGTYNLYEPMPVAPGAHVSGDNKVVLAVPCMNYFTTYPPQPDTADPYETGRYFDFGSLHH